MAVSKSGGGSSFTQFDVPTSIPETSEWLVKGGEHALSSLTFVCGRRQVVYQGFLKMMNGVDMSLTNGWAVPHDCTLTIFIGKSTTAATTDIEIFKNGVSQTVLPNRWDTPPNNLDIDFAEGDFVSVESIVGGGSALSLPSNPVATLIFRLRQ